MLKIIKEELKIDTTPINMKGERLEPEQKTTDRVMSTLIGTSLGLKDDAKPVGSIPGEIVVRSTAGEMAQGAKDPCWSCRSFNNARMKKILAYSKSDVAKPTEKTLIQELAGQLLGHGLASATEGEKGYVDEVMQSLAVCEALSDTKKLRFVHPEGNCPGFARSVDKPRGFYRPKDKAHAVETSKLYDKILRVAQKGPVRRKP